MSPTLAGLKDGNLAAARRVSLFRSSRNQAFRIPTDMELPGKERQEAVLREEGARLTIEPVQSASLLALLKTLQPIEDAFSDIDDPAPPPTML